MNEQAKAVRCREIGEADLDAVAALLTQGFPARRRSYWDHALQVLASRAHPEGYPRFGLMLEAHGACVGVLLQIFARVEGGAPPHVRCNLSSWHVAEAWRGYAPLLSSRAKARREVTYINVSPAEHTWPMLVAQGFTRYTEGQFACVPALSLRGGLVPVHFYRSGEAGHPAQTGALLDAHMAMGLIVLVCEARGGAVPFVFLPRTVKGVGRRVAQLAWRPPGADFTTYAGPLGRRLLGLGLPVVILDGEARVPGLVGRFFKDRAPKYFRGAQRPRLNDLAYTEAVLFGA